MTFPKESLIVVALDHRVHAVHCMNFERRALRQSGQRVRVLVYVEGTVSALTAPVDAKGLSDGENMRLVERAPWNDDSRRRWQVIHAARGQEAKVLGISPAMLWPGKSLEAIGLDPTCLERELTGESGFGVRKWQRTVFGPVLVAAMNTAK